MEIISFFPFETIDEFLAIQKNCVLCQTKLEAFINSPGISDDTKKISFWISQFFDFLKITYGLSDHHFRIDPTKSNTAVKKISNNMLKLSDSIIDSFFEAKPNDSNTSENIPHVNTNHLTEKRSKHSKPFKITKKSVKWFASAIVSDADSNSDEELD